MWLEADNSTEAGVGGRHLEIGLLDVAQSSSIAAVRRRCMQPAVWEHNI